MEIKEILNLITDAERDASHFICQAHGIIAERKTDARNVVTEYDKKVQESIVNKIREVIPDAHFFCEENDKQDTLDAEHVFIIDPIDGTMGFVHGFHHSCISVAYMSRRKILAGAIYNPYFDEMFTACDGMGAYLNGRRIHVDDCGLEGSLCCVGTSPYYPELQDKSFAIIRKLFDNSLDIRREGSAALDMCTISAGRAGFYFELLLSFWDFAAGYIIVKEAGGVVLTPEGNDVPLDGTKSGIIAGGEKAVKEFLKL